MVPPVSISFACDHTRIAFDILFPNYISYFDYNITGL